MEPGLGVNYPGSCFHELLGFFGSGSDPGLIPIQNCFPWFKGAKIEISTSSPEARRCQDDHSKCVKIDALKWLEKPKPHGDNGAAP